MQVDRAEMNRKLFAALRPGGFLVIADHSARPGDGTAVAKTCIASRKARVRQEIEAAGFELATRRFPCTIRKDPRDAAGIRPQIPTDEFVLKYQEAV